MIDDFTDWLCGDDLDPFMREVGPLQALKQDLDWMLREEQGSHVFSPAWGFGLETRLSKPFEPTLSTQIEGRFEEDDRVLRATCTISRNDIFGESYTVRVLVQSTEGFLEIVQKFGRPEVRAAEPASNVPDEPPPFLLSATPVPQSGGVSTLTTSNATADVVASATGITLGATTYISPTTSTVVVPAHAPGTFDIAIDQDSGSASLPGGLVVVAAPTLTSARLTAVPASSAPFVAGGDAYSIVGTGLAPGALLKLVGPANYSIGTTGSGTSLAIAAMPALLEGVYNAHIQNPDGQTSGTVPLIAVIDPVTLPLEAYFSQRGDLLDYHPTAGPNPGRWSDRSGNGRHLYQPTAGIRPNVSAVAVDGKYLVSKVYADGKTFPALGAMSLFATTTTISGLVVCEAPGSAGNNPYNTGTGYPSPALFIDGDAYQGFGMGAPGVATVQSGFARYDGAWKLASSGTLPANTILGHTYRHAAGVVQHGVNAAPSGATACGPVPGAGLVQPLQLLTSSDLSAKYATIAFSKGLTNAQFASFLNFERYRNLPTGYP